MTSKKILVFASGTATGGGSGADNLVRRSKIDNLGIEIVGLVSNHPRGGVHRVAEAHGIPFRYFSSGTWSGEEYRQIFKQFEHDLVVSSGWLEPIRGNNKSRTINIHPGRLPRFGGARMFGDNIHMSTLDAFRKGDIKFSGVSMHFAPDFDEVEYDKGPVFFDYWVPIEVTDSLVTLKRRVNIAEHHWQPYITSLVAHRRIRWDTKNNKIIVPPGYPFLPKS